MSEPNETSFSNPGEENRSQGHRREGRSVARRLFGVPLEGRTYANIGYLLLALPLGVLYFTWLVTAFALGLTLWIVLMGIPILFFTILTVYWMTGFERWLAIHLLGEPVPPMRRDVPNKEGFFDWVKGVFTTSATWKGLVFLFVKLPLGILSFTIAIATLATSAAFLFAPIGLMYEEGVQIGPWFVNTPIEALICLPIGVFAFLLTLHLLNGLAFVWSKFSSIMLGQGLPASLAGRLAGTSTGR